MEAIDNYHKIVNFDKLPDLIKRAMRLKSLRGTALLSVTELSDLFEISKNTYINFELGRKGGLTEKWAKKLVESYQGIKIFCSVNWLLYGEGSPPYTLNLNMAKDNKNIKSKFDDQSFSSKIIRDYRDHYSNTTHLIVCDDGMLPNYAVGDLVAGRLKHDKEINNILESVCIVETQTGRTYLRKIKAGSLPDRYNLICLNTNTVLFEPIILEAELLSAAPVDIHVRKEAL